MNRWEPLLLRVTQNRGGSALTAFAFTLLLCFLMIWHEFVLLGTEMAKQTAGTWNSMHWPESRSQGSIRHTSRSAIIRSITPSHYCRNVSLMMQIALECACDCPDVSISELMCSLSTTLVVVHFHETNLKRSNWQNWCQEYKTIFMCHNLSIKPFVNVYIVTRTYQWICYSSFFFCTKWQ